MFIKKSFRVSLLTKIALLIVFFSAFPLAITIGLFVWLHPAHFWIGLSLYCSFSVLTLIAAIAFAKHLTRPIKAFMQAIQRISQGDLTAFAEVRTHDELNDLGVAFNKMIEDMRRFREMRVDEIVVEKAKTEGIIYSSEDGILLTDHLGQVQIINPKATDILDLGETSREALSGRPVWSFVKDDRLAIGLREAVEGHETRSVREINLSTEGIRRFYTLAVTHIDPPQLADCNEWSVIILRNITAEKELQKLKDDFVQSLTHDLRSPLTAVRGYLQVLVEEMAGPVNEQQKKMLRVMENATTKLLYIISNLLDSAKISAGKLQVNLSEVNLRQLIPNLVEIMHAEAAKKKITLTVELPDTFSAINIDASLIERVIINLISNAVKFTPENGFITIKAAELSDRVQIQVVDTGPGIPAEFMDKMFKRFEQVSGTKGGTGLGLSNCKYIVEAHMGEIGVRSKLGEGSAFTFTLPKGLEQNEKGQIFRIRPEALKKAS